MPLNCGPCGSEQLFVACSQGHSVHQYVLAIASLAVWSMHVTNFVLSEGSFEFFHYLQSPLKIASYVG